MSKTIDERVVQMKFDNSNFEGNVKQSMSTLERLKHALKFGDSSKGLNDVAKAAKNVDMRGLGNQVETVRARFSALEVMGVTALANITNSAVNTGKSMIKALTIEPVMTGFQEYELKMNSVQTIMSNTASKGTTMADVTAVLDELNTYADKTIYNFAEMTRNIGTFTAAGVGLNDAASAIQGIANLAAASGSNSQQASTAMYQLSQALAAGTVKLMDWNSVVNAGMGGEKFQNALKVTAREMGIAVDAMIKKNGSFRESLSEGWLSADVLNTTLKKFTVEGAQEYAKAMMESGKYTQEMADALIAEAQNMEDAATKVKTFTQLWDTMKEAAQSGWAQTWELIIGDFEEAKEFLTQLSDMFGKAIGESADRRNSLLAEALGGSDYTWKQISQKINDAGIDIDKFKEKLVEVGKQHGAVTDEMIEKAGSFEKSLKEGWLSPEIIKDTVSGFTESMTPFMESTDEAQKKLQEFQKVVDEVWSGKWKNAPERYQLLADAGYDYAKVQELVNKTVDGHRLTLEDLSVEQAAAIGLTKDQIAILEELSSQATTTGSSLNDLIKQMGRQSGRELLLDSFLNVIKAVAKAINTVKDAWRDVFPATTANQLYTLIERFHSFTEWLIMSDDMANKLRATLRGLFSVLKVGTTLIGGAAKLAFGGLSKVIGSVNIDVLGFTSRLGDGLTSFSKWITNTDNLRIAVSKIAPYLNSFKEGIQGLVERFMQLEKVQTIIKTVKGAFSDFLEDAKKYFDDASEAVKEFIERLGDIDFKNISFETVKNILKDFKENVASTLFNVDDIMHNFTVNIKAVPQGISKGFGKFASVFDLVMEKIDGFAENLKSHIRDNINFGEIMAVGLGAGSIYFIKKFSDLLGKLQGPIEAVTGLITKFGNVFGQLSNVLKAEASKIKADTFLTIAKSIAVLAGSLALVAAIDSDKILQSIGVLTYLGGALVALSYAMSKIGGPGGTVKLGLGLAGLALSISILSKAMKDIASMNVQGLAKSMITLGIMMAAMVTLAKKMSTVGMMSKGSVAGIIAIAAALKLIVSSMKDLGSMDVGAITSSIVGMIAAVAAMKLLMNSMKSVRAGTAVAMIGSVLALKLLANSFKDLAEIDTNTIQKSITSFIVIFGMFSLLMKASQKAGKYAASGGIEIAAMSAGLILISQAMKTMASINPAGLERAKKAVSQLMIIMGMVTALSKFAGKYAIRAGIMIAMMAASLTILSGAMAVLSQLDPAGLENAVKAIATLELIFGMLIALSKFATGTKATIIALSVSVTLLAAAAGTLAMIDPASLRNSTACISILIGMMTLLVASTHIVKEGAGTIIILVGVIGALAGLLYLMSSLDATMSLQNAAAIATLMVGMSAMLAAMSVMKPMSVKSFAAMQSVMLVIAEIALVMGLLDKLEVDISMDNVKALVTMMGAFTILYGVLGVIGGLSGAAISGAAGLVGVVSIIGGFMVAVGALSTYFPKLKEFATEGIELLNIVASGIGEFIGNIAGGFLEGVSSHMPDVGKDLTDFMNNVMPFITAAKGIKPEDMAGIKSLGEALVYITGAEFLDKFASLGGDSGITKFGESLGALADGLNSFAEKIGNNVGADKVKAGIEAAKQLAELQGAIEPIGALHDAFKGTRDLSMFGNTLGGLADGITAFCDNLGENVGGEKMTAGIEAAKQLGELQGSIQPIAGILQGLSGTTNLDVFGGTFKGLADGLTEFSNGCAKLNADNIQKGVDAASQLAQLQGSIQPIGGIINTLLSGSTDFSAFGYTLMGLGQGLASFSLAAQFINEDDVAKGVAAMQALTPLQSAIEPIGGIISWFEGKSDLGTFGTSLGTLGRGLANFSLSVTEVNPEQITKAAAAAKGLAELLEILPEDKLFTNETWLDDFGAQLPKLGRGLASFSSSLSKVGDMSNIGPAVAACRELANLGSEIVGTDFSGFQKLSDSLKNFSADGINKFISAFEGASGRASAAATNFVNAFVTGLSSGQARGVAAINSMMTAITNAITSKQASFNQAGTNLLNGFTQGITSNTGKITSAFNNVLNAAINAVRAKYAGFQSAGAYIVSGLVNGIKSKKAEAVAAARDLASAVESAARANLQVQSPSKKFVKIGEYLCMGLAKGMDDNAGYAKTSAALLSRRTVDAMKMALKIKSPSKVTRDEVGNYIVEGIAEGIEANTSAEEAAKKKAQNIVNAFKEELDKFDLDTTTADLEYQLWEKLNGTASDADKAAMQAALNQKKLKLQAEKVQLAQGEYQTTLKELGAEAEETQEAYNKYLQEQISLAEIAAEVNSSQTNTIENNRQAYLKMNEWMNTNAENLQKLGYTMEQIEAAGREATGWDPNKPIIGSETKTTVEDIMKDAMSTVSGTYDAYAKTAFAQSLHQFNATGQAFSKATADGVQNGSPGAVKAAETMADNMTNTVDQQKPVWNETGEQLVEELQEGIENKAPEVMASVNKLVSQIKDKLDSVNLSSSGELINQSLAFGLADKAEVIGNSVRKTSSTISSSFSSAISKISKTINSEIDTSPKITPVLDLSQVSSGSKKISEYLNLSKATTPTITKAKNVGSGSSKSGSDSGSNSSSTTYNYTQNNYSPKALSQTDIYRQTNNLISKMKGR